MMKHPRTNILNLTSYGANIYIEVILTDTTNDLYINGRYQIRVYNIKKVDNRVILSDEYDQYIRYGREQDAVAFAYSMYDAMLQR